MEVDCFTILCFCHTTWTSQYVHTHTHTHTHISPPPWASLLLQPPPSLLSGSSQSFRLSSLCYTSTSLFCAQSLQSRLMVCDPIDSSPPGFSVHGIFQARILEWVAISFSRGSSQPRDQTHVSCIAGRFFTTKPPGNSNFPLVIYSTHGNACISVLLS